MQVFRVLLVVILLITVPGLELSNAQQQDILSKKYSAGALKEDAGIIRDVALAMHPAIGIYKPRAYYETLFNSFVAGLNDSLTEKQFRLKLRLLINELHCGHTEVLPSRASLKQISRLTLNYSPYLFMPLNSRLYLVANISKKQDTVFKKGMEVLNINGISADSLIRHSERFVSSDGYNKTAASHFMQFAFNSYYLALFGRPDTFNVIYNNGNLSSQIKYPTIKLKNFPSVSLASRSDSLLKRYRGAAIKFGKADSTGKSMVLKIESFKHQKYRRVYRKVFRKLKHNKVENLVIDLRNNGGGSIGNSYRLLTYLINQPVEQTLVTGIKNYPYKKYTHGNIWFKFTRMVFKQLGKKTTVHDTDFYSYTLKPRHKNHYSGKLYVLINGGSFSASCLVAAYLKYNGRAVFIGDETGGTAEGCNAGITPYYKLPNTEIRVRMPAYRVNNNVYKVNSGHGIMPDIKTEHTIDDVLKRRDVEMDKVKEILGIK